MNTRSRKTAVFLLFLIMSSCGMPVKKAPLQSYIQARTSYIQGNLETAGTILEELKKEKSLAPQVAYLRSKIFFMQGMFEEAGKELETLLRRRPEHTDARLWLIRTYLALNEIEKAETKMQQALVWSGEDPRFLSLSGTIQESRQQDGKALDYYRRAVFFEDELVKIYLQMAALYGRNRIGDKEEFYLRKAENLVSEDSVLRDAVRSFITKRGTPER